MEKEKCKTSPPDLTFKLLFNRFKKKLVNTASSVFTWENLPDTIDENYLTTELIFNGIIGIINTPDGVRAVRGNWGGESNEYYKPTEFIYANPILGSGNPEIGKDIAVMFLTTADNLQNGCDTATRDGLKNLIDSTACLLADNQLSLNIAQKNTRLMLVASADNEATSNSAEQTLKSMYNGEPYKVVTSKFGDTFTVEPLVNSKPAESMQQLIENYQFIWSTFLQELGINSNFNLKRERLVQAEVALNSECMDTLVDDIERNVNIGVDMCNSLFGTDIKFSVRRYGEEHAFKGLEERDSLETDSVATSQLEDKDGDNDGE